MYIIIFRKKVFFTNPTENTLLHGPVRPALLRYALPIILSMVATQFYSVADTMIIGLRLDADALAAVSNASTILMLFLFISGGMSWAAACWWQRAGPRPPGRRWPNCSTTCCSSILCWRWA